MIIYKNTIPLLPRSKKNSQQIIMLGNRPSIIQSKLYKQYEKDCAYFIKPLDKPIDYPVNVKCTFYRDSKRRVDLSNLISSISDILVKYNVLTDDNRNIVASNDGSRVLRDKANPRTEIEITKLNQDENYEIW